MSSFYIWNAEGASRSVHTPTRRQSANAGEPLPAIRPPTRSMNVTAVEGAMMKVCLREEICVYARPSHDVCPTRGGMV